MTTRVALVQMGSSLRRGDSAEDPLFDTAIDLGRAVARIAEAAQQGAKLIVFPEACLGGYPKGMDFGTRVGMRSPEGRTQFRRYFSGAIDVPGPETEALSACAKEHGVYMVIGCVERGGGTLYCTVLFFGPDGTFLGKHRKVMPTAMERIVWGFGDGSTLPVFKTNLGKLGAVICWENYMPLLRAAMYRKGIELYCACTVDDRDSWLATVRHIACEGRCFVLSCCQFVDGAIRGGTAVVSPLGEVIAGPVYGEEALLLADLPMEQILEGKFDLDVAGHYARPDIFRLEVDESARERIHPSVDVSGWQE